MSAFLKIDVCIRCNRHVPWEWVPPVVSSRRPFAGTGTWRSALTEERCSECWIALLSERRLATEAAHRQRLLQAVLGGSGAAQLFTFERFQAGDGNQSALATARAFRCETDNLYFAGPAGVGKTHLALAIAREMILMGRSVVVSTLPQLVRQLRMRPPEEEQAVLDRFSRADVLLLDDVAYGNETAFARQAVQEILDRRTFSARRGLLITSRLTPETGARRAQDPAIATRLMAMCRLSTLTGRDRRWPAVHEGTVHTRLVAS